MAKKQTVEAKKPKVKRCCHECAHSYDWHEKSVKGEVFMCWCPFHRYARFLYRDSCDKFKPRT